MKKSFFKSAYVFAAVSAFTFTSCGPDEDEKVVPPTNEEEVITTLKLTFTDKDDENAAPIIAQYRDLDGDGPNQPVITGATLDMHKTYTLKLDLLDETKSQASNISEEIKEEADEHQFFFQSTPAGLIDITITDKDSQNRPLGLAAEAIGHNAGTGTLKVVLKHQPGTKDGNITTGETDVDVDFPIKIQ